MKDEISVLLDFLQGCEPEVHGHGLAELNAQRMALIERFIAGQCNEVERRELSEFLQLHPAWIRWIADRVELSRELDGPSTAEGSSDTQMSA
jgi:hypothetical protein